MTKKLKLPLMIDSNGVCYALSQGTVEIDLVSAATGSVYKNHVTESEAIRFLTNGTWTVVGGPTQTAKDAAANVKALETIVTNRSTLLDEAKEQLKVAQEHLANVSQPFLV